MEVRASFASVSLFFIHYVCQVLLVFLVRFISGVQGFLIPFFGCIQVFFHAGSEIVAISHGKQGDREALVRGQPEEPERLAIILFCALLTGIIGKSEIELRIGISLVNGQPEILQHLFKILFNPCPVAVTASEIELRHRLPVFSGQAVVFQHLFKILFCSQSMAIEESKRCQGFRIVLRGSRDL